jgi:UDP-3-O-[3-hydroxymyristoyl] glucosamine N-acyltransferase
MPTLGEVAAASDTYLQGGDPATVIMGVAALDNAGAGQLSFLIHPRYRHYLPTTRAAAVIVSPRDAEICPAPALVADNPHIAYARAAALFEPVAEPQAGIHPTAWVDPGAQIAADARIGPHCVVEAGAIIEAGVSLGPHCVVGERAIIGVASRLMARVTVCHRVRLGRRVLAHPGAVIGSDGFGLALEQDGRWLKVPQLGSVQIGDDVEIGANTTIDRGALEDTVIEDGVKLDNQIQVAHNVRIGSHSALAGCVGIAGSARIGRHCMLGGGVGVAGHLTIADRVQVTGMSLVAQSITQSGVYSSGLTVEPNRLWNRISARLRRLDELFRRLTVLEKTIKRQDGSV